MAELIADRFVRRGTEVLDLAAGCNVRLKTFSAGTVRHQHRWMESSARAYAAGLLVDFGVLGSSQQFAVVAMVKTTAPARARDVVSIAEWLEHAMPASPRVLRIRERVDVRDIRLRGFVPCAISVFSDVQLVKEVTSVLRRRSIVLMCGEGDASVAALTRLRLCALESPDVCIVMTREPRLERITNAAETRAAYSARSPVADWRAAQMLREGEQLLSRGRHAAAERGFRGAMASFDRRNDSLRAGEAAMKLGYLLLDRGRAADAQRSFAAADDRFQRMRAAMEAIQASIGIGLAQTDLELFGQAEQRFRATHAAAAALARDEVAAESMIWLARVLIYRQRDADARAVLDAVKPPAMTKLCAWYWCLVSRLHQRAGDCSRAWDACRRAREATANTTGTEALLRRMETAVQGRLGDMDAVRTHVARGLQAARISRQHMEALKLRLTYIEALIHNGHFAQARTMARFVARLQTGCCVPPLLKTRAGALAKAITDPSTHRQRSLFVSAVHETATAFRVTDDVAGAGDLETVRELLVWSQHPEGEGDALKRASMLIRRHTHAVGVGIFSNTSQGTRLLACAGPAPSLVTQRAIEIAQPIRPSATRDGIAGSAPIHYLGQLVGAIGVRWSTEGPGNTDRAMAFIAAAATICAPLVQIEIERDRLPVTDELSFDLIGVSEGMVNVRKAIARAANAPFAVLIEGESGSGKELVARAIHRAGCRRDRRFCALNCAAMPEDLIDAELFGHAKGAFTGASGERIGLFESADGGTIFLDEVGELSARAQAKLLRVLQEGEVRRIGETFTRAFDVRVVAATNRQLRAEVEAGRFRHDLLYRLDVIRIQVPPLRERIEDLPLLAARFWRQLADRIESKAVLGQAVLAALTRYDWPGNIRELQNVLATLAVNAPRRGIVPVAALPSAIARAAEAATDESLEKARLNFEQRFVRAALARAAGHRGRAASALGLSRQGLAKLMQRLHLDA